MNIHAGWLLSSGRTLQLLRIQFQLPELSLPHQSAARASMCSAELLASARKSSRRSGRNTKRWLKSCLDISQSDFFPTCQVRVVRFYVSCLVSSPLLSSSSSPPAGPQPRSSTPSVRCRTSTTIIHAQCSLPDLNHDHPRPVFPAGPQPRPSNAQCSLPDLNHDHPRPVFPAGPQPRSSTPSVPCRTSTTTIQPQCSLPDLNLGPAMRYAR